MSAMAVPKIIIGIFVVFVLLIAFSSPVWMVFDKMEELGNNSLTPTAKDQTTYWKNQGYNLYSIIFGAIMVGGAVALFLAIVAKKRNNYDEYERYGGDYDEYNY